MTITEIDAVFAAIDIASKTAAESARFRAAMVAVLYDLLMTGGLSEPRK